MKHEWKLVQSYSSNLYSETYSHNNYNFMFYTSYLLDHMIGKNHIITQTSMILALKKTIHLIIRFINIESVNSAGLVLVYCSVPDFNNKFTDSVRPFSQFQDLLSDSSTPSTTRHHRLPYQLSPLISPPYVYRYIHNHHPLVYSVTNSSEYVNVRL